MDENRLVLVPDMFLQLLNPEFHSCVQTVFVVVVFCCCCCCFAFVLHFCCCCRRFAFVLHFCCCGCCFAFVLYFRCCGCCFAFVFVFNLSFRIVDTGQILLTMLGYLWRPIL